MFRKILLTCSLVISFTYAANAAEEIALPEPELDGKVSVEKAIYNRRSIRSYSNKALTLKEAAQLLWAAGGQTIDGVTGPTRAYASAGGAYPLEIYLVAGDIEGLEAGIYRYDWKSHALSEVKKGDYRKELAGACYGQGMVKSAPATIVITAKYKKTTGRYGERGRTLYVPQDAGHLGQNVHLQAESLGLGTVMIGAFTDSEVAKVLGTPKDETPVYAMPVGSPR
ncbi:MAG: SagB/ThcOx family dehydrogenase [Candidatus Omnitrophica bacterium]|nr:SagB/ThcOx family dehydrogenase [Candidatus Omnitrophota bacterium]